MASNGLIVTLYMMAMFSTLGFIVAGFLLFWFRDAVFKAIKLHHRVIGLGYIVARLKRHDRTELEIVVRPNAQTNSVRFKGVKGIYVLDNASVNLKNRKYAVYEWREGETAPINYQKETIVTALNCPHCEKKFAANVERPKSMDPSVLDNLILMIKTLTSMKDFNKYLLIIIILIGVGIIVSGGGAFLVYDFKKRIAEILSPEMARACTQALINAKGTIVA